MDSRGWGCLVLGGEGGGEGREVEGRMDIWINKLKNMLTRNASNDSSVLKNETNKV